MKPSNFIFCGLLFLVGVIQPLNAAKHDGKNLEKEDLEGWYVGVAGGFPFSVSTFNSFGTDKARFGWNVIPYVGYRFNPVLSLEGQAMWGQVHLSSRKEQMELLLDEWRFGDLQSDVFTQRYTAQLNVNILGFIPRTRYSRWSLEISPSLSAVGTKAHLRPIKGGDNVLEGNNKWHLGIGGNLQSSYHITRHFFIGLYTNIHFLTGSQLDNVPVEGYDSNYIWDIGVNFGWSFGKRK